MLLYPQGRQKPHMSTPTKYMYLEQYYISALCFSLTTYLTATLSGNFFHGAERVIFSR